MRIKNFLFMILGFLSLGIGAVGLVLPILPTTPFVLVSAACFSGTPAIRNKIFKIGFFKEHMENYSARTGLTKKTLFASLGYLWGMLLISMIIVQKLWLTILLVTIGTIVTVHILFMARKRKQTDISVNENKSHVGRRKNG